MEVIKLLNGVIGALFFFCFAYQFFYLAVPFFKKARPHRETV